LYALACAAKKTGVLVCAVVVMSNHVHLVVHDPLGLIPDFLRELHRNVAKVMNASQGQWENLWASEKTNLLPIADEQAVIDRIAYLATNPVSAGLVARPEDWPGVNLWRPGRVEVRRPAKYFDPEGPFPETVELRLVRPPRPALSEEEWERRLATAIKGRVLEAHRKMKAKGREFLGAAAVMAASFVKRAMSYENRREPLPKVAATEPLAKALMLKVRKVFLAKYREALRLWCKGQRDVMFPEGTWWLVRFHGAPVEREAG
jgi:REP element-mobilizing transposase RayT